MTKAIKTESRTFEIPISFDKVTLSQYVKWHNAENLAQKCAAALSCEVKECLTMRPQDMRLIVDGFQMVVDNELTRHEKIVHLNGKKYGFIPRINEISIGEYIELDEANKAAFNSEQYEKLIDLMAVVYRPVTMNIGEHYRVEAHTSREAIENRNDIEQLPMSIVSGALLFFSTIELGLLESSLRYLTTISNELKKEKSQLTMKLA
jgi:hypothetical protein